MFLYVHMQLVILVCWLLFCSVMHVEILDVQNVGVCTSLCIKDKFPLSPDYLWHETVADEHDGRQQQVISADDVHQRATSSVFFIRS